jgi:hypothetical protein
MAETCALCQFDGRRSAARKIERRDFEKNINTVTIQQGNGLLALDCTFTALLRKSLIINGAGEGNRTLVSGHAILEARVGFQLSPNWRNLRKSLEASVGIGRFKRRNHVKKARF